MSQDPDDSPSSDVGLATKQLIKARLRHFLYLSMVSPGAPDETMWRSLLSWQEDLLTLAEQNWVAETTRHGLPSRLEVADALPLAVVEVVGSLSVQKAALSRHVEHFVRFFDPRLLTGKYDQGPAKQGSP